MSSPPFLLSSLVLSFTSFGFLFASFLGGLVPLGDDKLCIDALFILFLFSFDGFDLILLFDLHLCLFKCFLTENVEHWFNFCVEIE